MDQWLRHRRVDDGWNGGLIWRERGRKGWIDVMSQTVACSFVCTCLNCANSVFSDITDLGLHRLQCF